MAEPTNIRIGHDVPDHINHNVRAINIDKEKGIKGLYCIADKKIIQYLFRKSKGWTDESALEYATSHIESAKSFDHIIVDQVNEFIKVIMLTKKDEAIEYYPNSPSFILTDAVEGSDKKESDDEDKGDENMKDGQSQEVDVAQGVEIIKIDNEKRMVYGVFLVPEEPDHDGDVISAEDIEKVAHRFMADYRTIDEMHKDVIDADIVESAIAWNDNMDFFGKTLKKGSWFGGVKVYDDEVWEKVKSGEYKGFSVRISGVRQTIE